MFTNGEIFIIVMFIFLIFVASMIYAVKSSEKDNENKNKN